MWIGETNHLRWRNIAPIILIGLTFLLLAGLQFVVLWEITPEKLLPPSVLPTFLAMVGAASCLNGISLALRPSRLQVASLMLGCVCLTTITLCDLVFVRAFGDMPRLGSLRYAGQLFQVYEAILSLLRARDLLLLLAFAPPIWLAFGVAKHGWALPRASPRQALVMVLSGLIILGATTRFRLLLPEWFGSTPVASRIGILGYHSADVIDTFSSLVAPLAADERDLLSVSEILTAKAEHFKSTDSDSGRRPNVVFLQVEALQSYVLDLEIDGHVVAPNLRRLASQGLYFSNFFPQTRSGNTSDAEFLALCSLYPSTESASFYEWANREFECLPHLLAKNGYRTLAFHANRPDFWNRAAMYPQLGISEFIHANLLPKNPKLGLGLADKEFLELVAERLAGIAEPYFAHIVTLTSHLPLTNLDLPIDPRLAVIADSRLRGYLNAISYTDSAIGEFLRHLEENGELEEMILVVYGDHEGVPLSSQRSFQHGINSIELSLVDRRVPLFIVAPGIEPHVDRSPGAQIDVAPTIAGLVGLEPRFFFGRDLIRGNGPRYANVRNRMIVGEELVWQNGCSLRSGARVDDAECKALVDSAEKEYRASGLFTRFNMGTLLGNLP